MLHEGSTHVTLMLSIVVAPEKMARYEAWLSEAEAILRRHDGFLSMDVIKPRSHIEPEYIILQRFRTPEALEAWRSSDDLAEIRRQASAFVLAAQEGERALGLDMMFERPQTGHLYPKPAIYKQILIAIVTVYPILMVMSVTVMPQLGSLPGPVAMLISVLIMAPIMTTLMPRVSTLFSGWLYPRRS